MIAACVHGDLGAEPVLLFCEGDGRGDRRIVEHAFEPPEPLLDQLPERAP